MRSAIVARVRDRNPMEVADDLGHRFWRLLPYGRPPTRNHALFVGDADKFNNLLDEFLTSLKHTTRRGTLGAIQDARESTDEKEAPYVVGWCALGLSHRLQSLLAHAAAGADEDVPGRVLLPRRRRRFRVRFIA